MLNIVIPMAGRGSRFADAGYTVPKPLIPVHGVPMIELVVENVRPAVEHRFIFICQKEHIDRFGMKSQLERMAPGCVVVEISDVTEGAACTVLLAEQHIDNDDPMMIVNSDQFVCYSIDEYLGAQEDEADGLIMTMIASDPKWSFVRLGPGAEVLGVVEKQVVSNEATVGIYNFRKGRDFVRAAKAMIAKNLRVNNEFYVAPVYNELIDEGKRIGLCNIGSVEDGMFGLGTPPDLEVFLRTPTSHSAARAAGARNQGPTSA